MIKYWYSSMLAISLAGAISHGAVAKQWEKAPFDDKFRQLEEILPTPNDYRNAAGAPGYKYWQQQADYHIKIKLDEQAKTLTGSEVILYANNSPDTLKYLWVQLDQNRFAPGSDYNLTMDASTYHELKPSAAGDKLSLKDFRGRVARHDFDGGYKISQVADKHGDALQYIINKTMMRIDLPKPLAPGKQFEFSIDWTHNINEQKEIGGRGGYECFEPVDDRPKNCLFEIAQWYPRVAAYDDVNGWQNKQFLGRGEFALEFGDFKVEITVPDDHIVAATGELQNAGKVLSNTQRQRLKQAQSADKPVLIVTEAEAIANEKTAPTGTKTWVFEAENVRDFAWASSRKFIWDAWGIKSGENDVMAMSFYPEEGNPLWETYSTHAIVHTIEHYNKYSFEYPYPVAISVNGPVGGMEYPMITFNGPRPEIDKEDREKRTYSARTKYGLISVIIHEIGHIYFPMIVNSDERQWTWMDEGLNTYLQFLAEQAWQEKYPSRRGEARKIVDYMASAKQVPIMTNSESILQFGNNAYGKPATALNILRETVMGRELFDYAFKEYAERWMFKRPMPADFFRTMEDASGVDLDWFWRGWFYTTDHVDISLDRVRLMGVDTQDPENERAWQREQHQQQPLSITQQRNQGAPLRVDAYPELKDFYNENDEFTVTNKDRNDYADKLKKHEKWEKQLLETEGYFYVMDFSNLGGLVMPLILQIDYADGTQEELRIPAEIWRRSPDKVSKMIWRDKVITQVVLDPHWETADVDTHNNFYPRQIMPSRLELFKEKKKRNLMKDAQQPLKGESQKPPLSEQ